MFLWLRWKWLRKKSVLPNIFIILWLFFHCVWISAICCKKWYIMLGCPLRIILHRVEIVRRIVVSEIRWINILLHCHPFLPWWNLHTLIRITCQNLIVPMGIVLSIFNISNLMCDALISILFYFGLNDGLLSLQNHIMRDY